MRPLKVRVKIGADHVAEGLVVDLAQPFDAPAFGLLTGIKERIDLGDLALVASKLLFIHCGLVKEDIREEVEVGVLEGGLLAVELGVGLYLTADVVQVVETNAEAGAEVGKEDHNHGEGDHV
jgi:hypothetical protein